MQSKIKKRLNLGTSIYIIFNDLCFNRILGVLISTRFKPQIGLYEEE